MTNYVHKQFMYDSKDIDDDISIGNTIKLEQFWQ